MHITPGFKDGGEMAGSRVHVPSALVKRLPDLRNRAKNQRNFSIYEDLRPKIEDIERSDDRKTSRTDLMVLRQHKTFFFLSP